MITRILVLTGALVCLSVCCACVGQAVPNSETPAPANFKECVAQGGKILKSHPSQCVTAEGARFIDDQDFPTGERGCKDTCGDGKCAEVTCMMLGCPCAESYHTCPSDCPAPK